MARASTIWLVVAACGVLGGCVGGAAQRAAGPVGSSSVEGPGALGACRPVVISATVRGRSAELHRCYQERVLKDPSLAGRLVVTWTIGADGRVTDVAAATVDPSLAAAGVADCITTVVKGMRFGAPEGSVCRVRYPFELKTRD